jgi:hypothetical protein
MKALPNKRSKNYHSNKKLQKSQKIKRKRNKLQPPYNLAQAQENSSNTSCYLK